MKISPFFSSNRYITILYFLNEVTAGGETAFPLADNATFDKQVRKSKYMDNQRCQQ